MALQWLGKGHQTSQSFAAMIFVIVVFQYNHTSVDSSIVTRLNYDVFTNPNPNKTNGERCRVYELGLVGGYCHNSNCTLCQCSSDTPTYIVHLNRCVKDSIALSDSGCHFHLTKHPWTSSCHGPNLPLLHEKVEDTRKILFCPKNTTRKRTNLEIRECRLIRSNIKYLSNDGIWRMDEGIKDIFFMSNLSLQWGSNLTSLYPGFIVSVGIKCWFNELCGRKGLESCLLLKIHGSRVATSKIDTKSMLPVVPSTIPSAERDILHSREDCNTTPTKATTTTQSTTSTVKHTKDEDEQRGGVQVKIEKPDSEVEVEEETEDTADTADTADRKRAESRVNIVALIALFGALVAVTLVVLVIISIRRGKQESAITQADSEIKLHCGSANPMYERGPDTIMRSSKSTTSVSDSSGTYEQIVQNTIDPQAYEVLKPATSMPQSDPKLNSNAKEDRKSSNPVLLITDPTGCTSVEVYEEAWCFPSSNIGPISQTASRLSVGTYVEEPVYQELDQYLYNVVKDGIIN